MAITTKILAGDVADMIGGDFVDYDKVYLWIEWNLEEGQAVLDTANNKIRLGSSNITVNSDGTWSRVGLITFDSADVQPTELLYRVHWQYPDDHVTGGRATGNSGWLKLMNADPSTVQLTAAMVVDYVPASWMTDAIATLQTYVDAGLAAETGAEAAQAATEAAITGLGVGTTTTGAPGTPASVTLTGTAPDRDFNFTIPEGEQGLPGPGAAAWTATQAVTVGSVRQAPDGSWIKSTADRTTRSSFDATEQGFWATTSATSGTLEQLALSATFAALGKVAATVSASGAAVVSKHNPVDATTAARSLSLPTAQPEGTQVSIEKVDASANTVSVTGNIRGVAASTLTLAWQYESIMFRADSAGSWWPIAGHKTKTSIDTAIATAQLARTGVPAPIAGLTKPGFTQPSGGSGVMTPWYSALGRRESKRANVVVIGDSWTEGVGATTFDKRLVSRIATALRARFPTTGVTGGRGYIDSQSTTAGTPSGIVWPAVRSGAAAGGFLMTNGPALYGVAMNPGGASAVTFTYSLVGTAADIVYSKGPSYGNLTYTVDGGSPVTITQANATAIAGQVTRVSLGAAGAHTLVITGATSGSNLHGVIEYNGDESAGITVHACGHGGYKSGDWSGAIFDPVANWPAAINMLGPDLIIIPLGTNDLNAAISAATFQANMTALMAHIRGGLTNTDVPIVLVSIPAMSGKSATGGPMMETLYAAAATDAHCLVADLKLRMQDYDTTPTRGLWYNTAHLSDAGYLQMGELIVAAISPS